MHVIWDQIDKTTNGTIFTLVKVSMYMNESLVTRIPGISRGTLVCTIMS